MIRRCLEVAVIVGIHIAAFILLICCTIMYGIVSAITYIGTMGKSKNKR